MTDTPAAGVVQPTPEEAADQTAETLADVNAQLDEVGGLLAPEGPLDVVEAEVDRAWSVLLDDFDEDEVSELLLACEVDPRVAETILEAAGGMRRVSAAFNGKARFYLHEEPNGSIYILRGLKRTEFRTSFLKVYYNDPAIVGDEGKHEAMLDAILSAAMVYPTFGDCDWDYEDPDKPHAPMPLTKFQLVNTFFLFEGPDAPVKRLSFEGKDVDNAAAHSGRQRERRAARGGL